MVACAFVFWLHSVFVYMFVPRTSLGQVCRVVLGTQSPISRRHQRRGFRISGIIPLGIPELKVHSQQTQAAPYLPLCASTCPRTAAGLFVNILSLSHTGPLSYWELGCAQIHHYHQLRENFGVDGFRICCFVDYDGLDFRICWLDNSLF